MKKYELEKNIVIYYDNQDNMGMSEKVIDFVWRNMDSDDSFELVQETHKSKVFKLNSEANTFYIKLYTFKDCKNYQKSIQGSRGSTPLQYSHGSTDCWNSNSPAGNGYS